MNAFRFTLPVAFSWALLACVIPFLRESSDSTQRAIVSAVVVFGLVLVALGFVRLRFAGMGFARLRLVGAGVHSRWPRFRETVIVTGFVATAFFGRLWSFIPLERPRYVTEPTFDVSWAADLRARLVDAAASLPGLGNELVPGLAVGDTTLVSQGLDADMKTVSLTHLVAVSGANCAIITAGVIAVVAICGGGRWMRALTACVALALFVIIVGPQPSVIRATVMAIILLVSVSSGHPSRGVPVLALAVFVLLLVDPTWALNIGFTLSVFATAALLVLAPKIEERLSAWMPRWLAIVIAIPLSAELVCQPVIAILAPGLPAFGIVANVLAAPAAPIATVTGLVAALVLPLSEPVGFVLLWLCWLPAQWIANVAGVCAQIPFARLLWPGGLGGVLLSMLLSTALTSLLIWPRMRRTASIVVALTLGVSLTVTVVSQSWRRVGIPGDWLIAACDIGQGDALLVRSAPQSRQIMMIDTGRDESLLRRCLYDLGVNRIDLLVLTHYDQDHVGAYSVVLGRVNQVLAAKPIDASENEILRDLEGEGAMVGIGRAGLSGDLGESGFRWRQLWPAPGHPDMQSGNPGSLVIRTEWASNVAGEPALSAMFLGDLDEDAQRALLRSTSVRPATVVKVAHHGSADQHDALYERLRARIALVSAGADNGYGHPTDRALKILANTGTAVARTDTQGLLLVRRVSDSAGDRLEVWSER